MVPGAAWIALDAPTGGGPSATRQEGVALRWMPSNPGSTVGAVMSRPSSPVTYKSEPELEPTCHGTMPTGPMPPAPVSVAVFHREEFLVSMHTAMSEERGGR